MSSCSLITFLVTFLIPTHVTSSLLSHIDSYHNQYFVLRSQDLKWYNFIIQINLPIWISNKKEIYLWTFHPTLICNKMFTSFHKARICYSKIKIWWKLYDGFTFHIWSFSDLLRFRFWSLFSFNIIIYRFFIIKYPLC